MIVMIMAMMAALILL